MGLKPNLHVICRKSRGDLFHKGVSRVAGTNDEFESVSWRLKEDTAHELVGGLFHIHQTKSSPSDYGGEILAIDFRPIADNDGEIRAVVRFRVTMEARGVEWPTTNNPNEFVHVASPGALDQATS